MHFQWWKNFDNLLKGLIKVLSRDRDFGCLQCCLVSQRTLLYWCRAYWVKACIHVHWYTSCIQSYVGRKLPLTRVVKSDHTPHLWRQCERVISSFRCGIYRCQMMIIIIVRWLRTFVHFFSICTAVTVPVQHHSMLAVCLPSIYDNMSVVEVKIIRSSPTYNRCVV